MAQKQTIVGIDVSKAKVDVAIRSAAAQATFADAPDGQRQLLVWLKEYGVDKAVMEATGGYERSWIKLLSEAGLEVVTVDPKRVRHFAKSAGQLAKNDPIDARMMPGSARSLPTTRPASHGTRIARNSTSWSRRARA
jgi:transposase